ncbi:hypothetical protein WJX74_002077 [Apatococcus lobatus]|uniref:S-acyltransferase n=1 Tax=Apatococcus lobatus TaxID=904363 RepID=A0AAW1QKR9_9CHLO
MSAGSESSANLSDNEIQETHGAPLTRGLIRGLQCGWCGCILSQGGARDEAQAERSRQRPGQLAHYHRLVPFGVTIFILTVTVVAVNVLLNPLLGSSHWYFGHCLWSLCLFINIMIHYAGATIQTPAVPGMPLGPVAKMSLDDCTLCRSCQAPKACRTHHCRVCRQCVPECCHHCIFLGQCVGAHNLRHFLLFLVFTIVGCCYIFLLAVVMLHQRWPIVLQWWHESPALFPSQWWRVAGLLSYQARMLWSAPPWLSLVTWDILAVLNSGIGLTALLLRQLRFVLSGRGYIDRMKGRPSWQKSSDACGSSMYQLRKAFAFEPALCWLRPAWKYPTAREKRDA